MMVKIYPFIVVLLQLVISHHAYELPRNNFNRYMNFENFDDTVRSGRQVSSGFDWDSPSDSYQNNVNNNARPNGFGWNSGDDPDSFIFEDDFANRNYIPRTTQRGPSNWQRPSTQRTPTSTIEVPGMGTARTPCEDRCLSTPEYNPVCGDDDMTYFSGHRLSCAQKCGKRVKLKHLGACTKRPPRG